ncbi:MAG: hypothetical protein H6943_10100 [Zoogloeaceae bacterium]|nr:hypothetical protein [Zoogloeaceae bacterium]
MRNSLLKMFVNPLPLLWAALLYGMCHPAAAASLPEILQEKGVKTVIDTSAIHQPTRILPQRFLSQEQLRAEIRAAKSPALLVERIRDEKKVFLELWKIDGEEASLLFEAQKSGAEFTTISGQIEPDPCADSHPKILLVQTSIPQRGERPFMPGPPLEFYYHFENGRYVRGDSRCAGKAD